MSEDPNKIFLDNFTESQEGDIDARIEQAKKRAREIYYKSKNIEDLTLCLSFFLSQYYRIPMFSQYFKDLTLDELILETELIKLDRSSQQPAEAQTKDIMKDKANQEELSGLFDDMFEEDMEKERQKFKSQAKQSDEWVPVEENPMDDDEFDKIAQQFMQTGEFVGDSDEEQ